MSFYSYKMTRDYGFAPNPFGGLLTLANCKPHVRKNASVNDWILGTGSKDLIASNRVFHLVKVTERITFLDYWSDERFQKKKPILNGSIVQMYGDNIYYKDANDKWCQLNSHHSLINGINQSNLENDLGGEFVLVSSHFFYFGKNNFKIPTEFKSLCCKARDYCKPDDSLGEEFVHWVQSRFQVGVHGDPYHWSKYEQLNLAIT